MSRHHPMASLAPRDIVARGIDTEMKRTGDKHVYLDCTHIPEEEFRKKFPNIFETCRNLGIHPPGQMIPVVPPITTPAAACWSISTPKPPSRISMP